MLRESRAEYDRKLAAAFAQAQAAGLKRAHYNTWLDRLLRRMGYRLPPTLFARLRWFGVLCPVYFALTWGIAMHFLFWADRMPFAIQAATSGIAGALFGVSMALYQRYFRRKHNLSPWSEL